MEVTMFAMSGVDWFGSGIVGFILAPRPRPPCRTGRLLAVTASPTTERDRAKSKE
jgi:hypothetical protein